mgnify:CR=1 FL=1
MNNTMKNNALKVLLLNFFIAQTPELKIQDEQDNRMVEASKRNIKDILEANPFLEEIFSRLYLKENGELTPYARAVATKSLNENGNNNYVNFERSLNNIGSCLAALAVINKTLSSNLENIESLTPRVMELVTNVTTTLSKLESLPVDEPVTV